MHTRTVEMPCHANLRKGLRPSGQMGKVAVTQRAPAFFVDAVAALFLRVVL